MIALLLTWACVETAATEQEAPEPTVLHVETETPPTTDELIGSQADLEDQKLRLEKICVDYPDHEVCAPQTAAAYALASFCEDGEFTQHIDAVVQACHQGQCKQVDEAALLTRKDYMLLVQRLPHTLVTFRAKRHDLDRKDQDQLQKFVENINAERGYVIIVGRASKDGPWEKNLQYALDRANETRAFMVDQLGLQKERVGYITYGHEKMYLTALDAERLTQRKLTVKQANRSALVFTYPCHE